MQDKHCQFDDLVQEQTTALMALTWKVTFERGYLVAILSDSSSFCLMNSCRRPWVGCAFKSLWDFKLIVDSSRTGELPLKATFYVYVLRLRSCLLKQSFIAVMVFDADRLCGGSSVSRGVTRRGRCSSLGGQDSPRPGVRRCFPDESGCRRDGVKQDHRARTKSTGRGNSLGTQSGLLRLGRGLAQLLKQNATQWMVFCQPNGVSRVVLV